MTMKRSCIAALVALGLAGAACSPAGPTIMGPERDYVDELRCIGERTRNGGCRTPETERMQLLVPVERGRF